MASKQAILEVFKMFATVGLPGTPKLSDRQAVEAMLHVWAACCSGVTDDGLRAAAVSYLQDPGSEWFPRKPGTLLALVPGRQESEVDMADSAWGHAIHLVSKHGRDRGPGVVDFYGMSWTWQDEAGPYDPAALSAGVEALGGWRALCDVDNETTARHSFRAAYRSMVERKRIAEREGNVIALLGTSPTKRLGGK